MPGASAKTVLVTGFEPFGGETINPSAEAVHAIAGTIIAGHTIEGAILPCVFGGSSAELARLIAQHQPALVLCVGQATGRSAVNLERVAINIEDASMPDNSGARPIDSPISKDGPVAYWSTLPIRDIVRELQASRIAAAISHSAGSFVCNHVFYRLMESLQRHPEVPGGFVHVPLLPEQAEKWPGEVSQPSMRLEQVVDALRIAIRVSLLADRKIS